MDPHLNAEIKRVPLTLPHITQTPASGLRLNLLDFVDPDYSPADNYLGGKYVNFGTAFPDKNKLRDLSHGGSLITTISPTGDSGSYTAHERITACYVMDEMYLNERTTLLAGIRFEASDVTYGAPQYVLNPNGGVKSWTIFNGNTTYLNPLPGVHLRHTLANDTVFRFSYSRSLARPNYSDLAPFVLQDTTALTISQDNPNLKDAGMPGEALADREIDFQAIVQPVIVGRRAPIASVYLPW